jgi:hypothetical protein
VSQIELGEDGEIIKDANTHIDTREDKQCDRAVGTVLIDSGAG